MEKREFLTEIYILAIAVVAVWFAIGASILWPIIVQPHSIWLISLLILLIVLAGRFSIILSRQAEASLFTVPLYTAILLLHPTVAALIAAAGTLIFQLMLRRSARAVTFNVSVATLAGALGGIVYYSLRPDGAVIAVTQGHMVAAALAGLVMHLHNIIPVVGMITLRKGRQFWMYWADSYTLEAVVEGILLSLGLMAAILAVQATWGLGLMVLPAFAAYHLLKRTVEYAAKKGMLAEELERRLATELDGWEGVSRNSPYQPEDRTDVPILVTQQRPSLRSALR